MDLCSPFGKSPSRAEKGFTLRDLRDRTILMVALASGGCRRGEIAGLHTEPTHLGPTIPVRNCAPSPLQSVSATPRPSSTNGTLSSISPAGRWGHYALGYRGEGQVFWAIGRTLSRRTLNPQSVNAIVKHRAAIAAGVIPCDSYFAITRCSIPRPNRTLRPANSKQFGCIRCWRLALKSAASCSHTTNPIRHNCWRVEDG